MFSQLWMNRNGCCPMAFITMICSTHDIWYVQLHSTARLPVIHSYAREDPMEPASIAVLMPGRLDAQNGEVEIKCGRIRTWGTDDKPWANHLWPIKGLFRFQRPWRRSECKRKNAMASNLWGFLSDDQWIHSMSLYCNYVHFHVCICMYVTCICFVAANWWLIILCKAWWDFNLPGDCSCVVAKKRREQSQGSEPCDMFLQWKLPLDSRSSQLFKMAIWCMYTEGVYIISEYDDM